MADFGVPGHRADEHTIIEAVDGLVSLLDKDHWEHVDAAARFADYVSLNGASVPRLFNPSEPYHLDTPHFVGAHIWRVRPDASHLSQRGENAVFAEFAFDGPLSGTYTITRDGAPHARIIIENGQGRIVSRERLEGPVPDEIKVRMCYRFEPASEKPGHLRTQIMLRTDKQLPEGLLGPALGGYFAALRRASNIMTGSRPPSSPDALYEKLIASEFGTRRGRR